jgi:glycosyltransferase involved in cell wall biosynthesis
VNSLATTPVPKVSVVMITYNHEKFIAQAIESVLMQKTDFPIELIIGEDCSKDGTRAIVRRYAEARPDVIRAFLHEHNVGANENSRTVRAACRGKYIAWLEGDDYWTDQGKLQKQVALMDLNPQYSMCGTAARQVVMLPDGQEREVGLFPPWSTKRLYNLEDVLTEHPFKTLTFVLRNGLVEFPDWFQRAGYGDMCVLALYAEKGPVAYLDDVTATYRIHDGGIWSGSSASERCKTSRGTLDLLNDYFSGHYIKVLRNRDFRISERICLEAACEGRGREAKQIYWESFGRFAPYMPIAYFMFGVLVYGNKYKYVLAWHQLTRRIAIRTRIRRLLQSGKRF